MVDQKEEAKKEKFIETMPMMIQTHLITCKYWATVKDTAKSLEHIIKPKQTRGRGKPKGKPQEQRQNPPKAQEADETYTYENPNNYYHNAPSQSRGRRLYNGQSGNQQSRGFVP